MSPTCWQDEIEARADKCTRVEDELEELKYWVQDLSHKVDYFMENFELYEEITSRKEIVNFIKELQETLGKKKNIVMGYDNAKS